MKRFCSNFTAY